LIKKDNKLILIKSTPLLSKFVNPSSTNPKSNKYLFIIIQLFVENPDFDPTHLFHLFETVDYAAVADTLDTPLTTNQENIVKFIKQFDEEMAIRREEQ